MSFCVGFCRVLFLCRLLPLPLHVCIWRDYYSIMCLKLHFFLNRMCYFSIYSWLCTYVQRHMCRRRRKWHAKQPTKKVHHKMNKKTYSRESKLYYIQEAENKRIIPRNNADILHFFALLGTIIIAVE